MSKKVIRASDYWKNSKYAHVLDQAKRRLQGSALGFDTVQVIRELMTALIRSENLIPEDDEKDPPKGWKLF